MMWFQFGLTDLQVDKVAFLTSPTMCEKTMLTRVVVSYCIQHYCSIKDGNKDDQKVSGKLKSIFSHSDFTPCVCWCSLIVTTEKQQHILVLYEHLFFFFLIGFDDNDLKWAVTVSLLRSSENHYEAKLFVCRCWSLKDCCWLIAASVAGGCSPCLGCILQWLDLPRPQTCGNAALTSLFTCDVWTNQRDEL